MIFSYVFGNTSFPIGSYGTTKVPLALQTIPLIRRQAIRRQPFLARHRPFRSAAVISYQRPVIKLFGDRYHHSDLGIVR